MEGRFFSADYPGWIATAAHVLIERNIVRILNRQGETLMNHRH